jgi:hypothetical protein
MAHPEAWLFFDQCLQSSNSMSSSSAAATPARKRRSLPRVPVRARYC